MNTLAIRQPLQTTFEESKTAAGAQTIFVEERRVYGDILLYPACATSRGFSALTGTKTLSRSNIATIKAMGYRVLVKPIASKSL